MKIRLFIPPGITLIILFLITSCSTSNLSVSTIRVKHRQKEKIKENNDETAIAELNAAPEIRAFADKDSIKHIAEKKEPITNHFATAGPSHRRRIKEMINEIPVLKIISLPKATPSNGANNNNDKSYHVLGILSIVSGVIGIILAAGVIYGLPFALVAIIFGLIAKSHGEKLGNTGFILGLVGIFLAILFLIIYVVVIVSILATSGI